MSILFVNGTRDDNYARIVGPKPNGSMLLSPGGCIEIRDPLKLKKNSFQSVMLYGKRIKQPKFKAPKDCSVIVNQIAEPDTHNGALQKCITLCRKLAIPVINRPELILRTTRDGVSSMLRDIAGVVMPMALRARPRSPDDVFIQAKQGGLEFPFIVRSAGAHDARDTVRIRGPEDHDRLHVFPYDGQEFYLIQFIDYRNDDDVYVKKRIIVIDGQPHIRHCIGDRHWNVHVSSLETSGLNSEKYSPQSLMDLAESRLALARPAVEEISKRIGLDIFGIDCNINPEGELVIFEVNAQMDLIRTRTEFFQPFVERFCSLIKEMISKRSGEHIS